MTTQELELALTQCDNKQEFEALVNGHQDLFREDWGNHFRRLALMEHDLTTDDIAAACGVSPATARSYCKRVPAKRRDVIFLAMRMGMTVQETNNLLVNWAKYHRLYAKNPDDVICIYLLVAGCKSKPAATFEAYREQYRKLEEKYRRQKAEKTQNEPGGDTNIFQQRVIKYAKDATLDPENDVVFNNMMVSLLPGFSSSYTKLIRFINSFFSNREQENLEWLHNKDFYSDRRRKYNCRKFSPDECFDGDKVYLQKYYKACEKIKKEHTVPGRLFLVSLGIRLNMTVRYINEMLDLAGMGPLSPHDRLDAAIVYLMEEAEIQNPGAFYTPASLMGANKGDDELYAFDLADELRRLQRNDQEPKWTVDMWRDFEALDRLSEQSLNEYLRWRLEDMSIFQGHSRELCDKFIELL